MTGVAAGPQLAVRPPRSLLLTDCLWRGGWLAVAAGLVMGPAFGVAARAP